MKNSLLKSVALLIGQVAIASPLLASDVGTPAPEELAKLYPGKTYSPWAQRAFPNQVFWGETHLHTGLSLDAGLFGNILEPDDGFRFARGELVTSSTGVPARLARPLDWVVLTDHTDMMGIATDLKEGTPNIMERDLTRGWHEAFNRGGQDAGKAAFELIGMFSQLTLPEDLVEEYSPGSDVFRGVWETIVDSLGSMW